MVSDDAFEAGAPMAAPYGSPLYVSQLLLPTKVCTLLVGIVLT
jgi:hypothetical protein